MISSTPLVFYRFGPELHVAAWDRGFIRVSLTTTEYALTLTTSLLATLPLIVMFMFFQRQIIESMSATGLKE